MVESWSLLSVWGKRRDQDSGSQALTRHHSNRTPPVLPRFMWMFLLLLVLAAGFTILFLASSGRMIASNTTTTTMIPRDDHGDSSQEQEEKKISLPSSSDLEKKSNDSNGPEKKIYLASSSDSEKKSNDSDDPEKKISLSSSSDSEKKYNASNGLENKISFVSSSKSEKKSDDLDGPEKKISLASLDLEKKSDALDGPYHNLQLFTVDYQDMIQNLKIYVYPTTDTKGSSSLFPRIFQPMENPAHPSLFKLGNYYSEHAFKSALFQSSLLTHHPEEAHFFYMPFSINAMRNEPRIRSGASIVQFVANYTNEISSNFPFWNASGGSDHLYVCCHSIGRDASAKHHNLHNNAIQVTCSSGYFQRHYVTHKDVPLAQVWPRPQQIVLNPPHTRNRLVFFVGRKQNSLIRQILLSLFGNDASMDIFGGNFSFPYEEGFRRSRFCLHVKGYEVNTARISDAIHYGCIPVIISDYYDLPFTNVLDWSKFSIIISQGDIHKLKDILLSVSKQTYITMYRNLCSVRRHFAWHMPPQSYDSFFMTAYQLWLRRGLHRLQSSYGIKSPLLHNGSPTQHQG